MTWTAIALHTYRIILVLNYFNFFIINHNFFILQNGHSIIFNSQTFYNNYFNLSTYYLRNACYYFCFWVHFHFDVTGDNYEYKNMKHWSSREWSSKGKANDQKKIVDTWFGMHAYVMTYDAYIMMYQVDDVIWYQQN